MKRMSQRPDLPPIRSRSVFQLFPYGGFDSMKSNSLGRESVVGKRGPEPDVVRLDPLALQDQVGLADRVGLRVHFLPVQVNRDFLVLFAG